MITTIQEFAKKYGIWSALFISLLIFVIQGYEKREAEYMQHESQYHKIIEDNNKIMQDNTKIMQDTSDIMKGYKTIIEVNLVQLQKEVERIRSDK